MVNSKGKSRTQGVFKTLSCNIDPRFDTLNIATITPFTRSPKAVPHCDCADAVAAHKGLDIKQRLNANVNEMVPTEVDKDSCCLFCQHYAPHLQERSTPKIIGTHVSTGEVIMFDSVKAAIAAGFKRAGHCIRNGRVNKGYSWRKV